MPREVTPNMALEPPAPWLCTRRGSAPKVDMAVTCQVSYTLPVLTIPS